MNPWLGKEMFDAWMFSSCLPDGHVFSPRPVLSPSFRRNGDLMNILWSFQDLGQWIWGVVKFRADSSPKGLRASLYPRSWDRGFQQGLQVYTQELCIMNLFSPINCSQPGIFHFICYLVRRRIATCCT